MMTKTDLETMHPFRQIVILLMAVMSCLSLVSLFALAGMKFIFHVELAAMMDAKNLRAMKFMQIMSAIGMFVVPPLVFAAYLREQPFNYLKLNVAPKIISVLLVFLIMICAMPFINVLSEWNQQLHLPDFIGGPFDIVMNGQSVHFIGIEQWIRNSEDEMTKLMELFIEMKTPLSFIVNMLMLAVIPAIGEELLFRGVLQKLFINWTKSIHIGIFITAVLFSAFHFQFLGFFPRAVLGVLLGYLFVWSGSIWLNIFAHFVNNGFAVVFSYLEQRGNISKEVENIGTGDSALIWGITSAVLVAGLIYLLWRKEEKEL